MARFIVLVLLVGCKLRFDSVGGDAPAVHDAPDDVAHDAVPDAVPDAAAVPNQVFVTSLSIAPSSGRAALDAFCNTRAAAGGLPGSYVAFVSTSTQDARDRLIGSRGWVRHDGLGVLDTVADFDDQSLPRPIVYDELGAVQTAFVMTGSNFVGRATANTCGNWSSTTGSLACGVADNTYPAFVGFANGGCGAPQLVYCFGVGNTAAGDLRPTVTTGRYAFVSDSVFNPATGVAAADSLCQTDAGAAGLPGTYRALLATSTTSIATHVGTLAGAWRRPDNVAITAVGLDQPPYDAVIDLTASRAVYTSDVFLGAVSPTALASTTANCVDWSSSSSNATVSYTYKVQPLTQSQVNGNYCATQTHVFCAQM